MKKLFLLPLLLLAACSSSREIVSKNPNNYPVYCIRGVEDLGDGTVLLDMPGFYHGRNDAPMRVNAEVIETITVPYCTPDDPRMTEE